MATRAELLNLLKQSRYTYRWGAIAVFDGANIAQRLADHYSLMVHGPAALKPITAERIYLLPDHSAYATLHGLVLAAPRIDFVSNSLQDSQMRVSFELAMGVYTEQRVPLTSATAIKRMINAGVGRSYTFSFDVNLNVAEGDVDQYGAVQLKLGGGTNPRCDLGSSDLAQYEVGQFLLEQIKLRYGDRAVTLPLGWIETDRGHTLPSKFMLRTQAKPGSTTGEGALVLLIARRDGALGDIPADRDFPYLIPDDLGSSPGATILVSNYNPKLLDGEAEAVFGQILFPNERYFSTVERHTDTLDEVVFGRLERPAAAQRAVRPQLNEVGVTAQLLTVEVGGTPRPVTVRASSDSSQVWQWGLRVEGLGSLAGNGAQAVYTPPRQLEDDQKVLLQWVTARHAASGRYHEVCILLQAGSNGIAVNPLLSTEIGPGFSFPISAGGPSEDTPGIKVSWKVLGEGAIVNKQYVAPSNPTVDIDVIVYECSYLTDAGAVYPLGFGYGIVQLNTRETVPHWQTLVLKLKATSTGARPYNNGLHQLAITVTWDTGTNGLPVLPEELATLRLVFHDGREVPLLPDTLEGLTMPDSGSTDPVSKWAFKTQPNRFTPAKGPTGLSQPVGPSESKEVTFYLHTLDVLPARFAVRLTDISNQEHTSSDSGGEQDERILTVTPEHVPLYSAYNFEIKRKRVEGGYTSNDPSEPIGTPEEPNFTRYFTTVDYWNYQLLFNGERVSFVRLQWEEDGPGVRWGSQVANEDGFSYLGYVLNPVVREPVPQTHVRYATELYNPVLYNSDTFLGEVPHSTIIQGERGDAGTLLISLNREVKIFYRQKKLIPGFDLERPFTVVLWDQNGSRHRIQFAFEGDERNKITTSIQPV